MSCQKLQLIRKPDRDWNVDKSSVSLSGTDGYNSLENPIGIETASYNAKQANSSSYNSLENPIGIETASYNAKQANSSSYNSLENPIGIETLWSGSHRLVHVGVTTH